MAAMVLVLVILLLVYAVLVLLSHRDRLRKENESLKQIIRRTSEESEARISLMHEDHVCKLLKVMEKLEASVALAETEGHAENKEDNCSA